MSTQLFPTEADFSLHRSKLGQQIALAGLVIYVVFAPHSVAASSIGVGIAGIGWLIRTLATGSLGCRRSKFDLIILLSLLWTVASALTLRRTANQCRQSFRRSWVVFLFYLTRATLDRRSALLLIALLIVSGCAGALYSAFDLVRGRGVVVETDRGSTVLFTRLGFNRATRSGELVVVEFIRSRISMKRLKQRAAKYTDRLLASFRAASRLNVRDMVLTAAQQQRRHLPESPGPNAIIDFALRVGHVITRRSPSCCR